MDTLYSLQAAGTTRVSSLHFKQQEYELAGEMGLGKKIKQGKKKKWIELVKRLVPG